MRPDSKRRCGKVMAFVGSLFLVLPNGVLWYFGNMAVYVNSYIVVILGQTKGVEEPWVISIFLVFWTAGHPLYGCIKRYTDKRWGLALGVIMTNAGIFLSYFSVQTSFALFIVTLGVMTGIGTGLVQAHELCILIDWADGDTGFLTSSIQGAFNLGATIINELVTLYVNPLNDVPKAAIGNSVYFTQRDILDKVPSMFFVLGGFSVCTQIVGCLLIRENTPEKQTDDKTINEELNVGSDNPENNQYSSFQDMRAEESIPRVSSNVTLARSEKGRIELSEIGVTTTETKRDMTPKEVFKSANFYIIWFAFLFAEYPLLLLANYYKILGQLRIHDDHFLTVTGTVLSFVNMATRAVWGYVVDRIGVRKSMAIQVFFMASLSLWFYFTAIVDKWLYFVINTIFGGMTASMFGNISVTVVSLYGKTYFSIIFGMIRSSSIVLAVAGPFVINAILGGLGWYYTFASAGFVNVIGLALILYCLPHF